MTKLAAFFLLAAILPAQPARFGAPACAGAGRDSADRGFFVVCLDADRKVPVWTAHELLPGRVPAAVNHPHYFRQDALARNSDYRGSGFSRGHLVPAEDLAWSDQAMRSTYVLSNAVPQLQSVNAGVWRELEVAVRILAARSEGAYVVTGPIFAGAEVDSIGEGQIAVPTHLFKVVLVLGDGRKSMYAAIVPNAPLPRGASLDEFSTTVGEVERQTGLDFFTGLDAAEQRRLKSSRQGLRD